MWSMLGDVGVVNTRRCGCGHARRYGCGLC